MIEININSSELVRFTNKLEKLNKYDLPIAVRETLNKTGKYMKQNSLLVSTRINFTIRKETFFKRFSRIIYATGLNTNNLRTVVGFFSHHDAVKNLQAQEFGGKIPRRDYIPLDTARKDPQAGNKTLVKPANRLAKVSSVSVVNQKNFSGTQTSRFFKTIFTVAHRYGKGFFIAGNSLKTLYRLNTINFKTGKFKVTALYNYKESRSVNVTATHFILEAAISARKKTAAFFSAEMKKRLVKYYK